MTPRDAFCRVAHEFGVASMAVKMGCNRTVLQNKANPRAEGHVPTLKDCVDATIFSGSSLIADSFCAIAGGVFVKTADFVGVSDTALLETVTAMTADLGRVCSNLNDAMASGDITPEECERIRNSVRELSRASAEFMNRVEHLVVEPRIKRVAVVK